MYHVLYKNIKNKKLVKNMITELSKSKNNEQFHVRERYAQSKLANEIFKYKELVHINNPMKTELKFIKDVLSNLKQYNLNTPIAHMIDREADFIA